MIPTQPFGRTGHQSTRIIFGAAALGQATQDEADRGLELLLEYGINHIDTAASYGDAELRIGPWMDRHRDDFFLATKTGERSYSAARDEIHRSLERLRVNRVDLVQLHNLVDPIEWDQAMNPGGALEAALEAQREGLVRLIGVTGHGTPIAGMHRRSLERHNFDSVLLPYSYVLMQDPKYARDVEDLMTECVERDVAVQTIKAIARRPWPSPEHMTTTWYEPLTAQEDIDQAVWWVLDRPGIFLNSASDLGLLARILDAAERHEPLEQRPSARLQAMDLQPLFV